MDDLVNLNSAPIEELTLLPGVGSALAERIIAERPFESLDDLLSVRGVGPAFLDRLGPLVTLETSVFESEVETLAPEGETEPEVGFILVEAASNEAGAASIETGAASNEAGTEPEEAETTIPPWEGETTDEVAANPEAESEIPGEESAVPPERAIIPVTEKPTPEKPSKKEKSISRGGAFLIAAVCSFLAFVLATIVSLGSIAIINGGLRYASATQIEEFTREVDAVSLQADILASDLASIDARLSVLENDIETLSSDLNAQVETLNEDIEALNTEIEDLQESSQFFQEFLDGLRNLLDSLPTP